MWTCVCKINISSPETFAVLIPQFLTLEEAKVFLLPRLEAIGFNDTLLLVEIDPSQKEIGFLSIKQSVHINSRGRIFWPNESSQNLRVIFNPYCPS